MVCDVDSTLIENEAIDLLAELAGSGDEVSKITEQAMAGKLDFESSLRSRVATLSGMPVAALDTVRSRLTLTKGALELAEEIHRLDGRICAVSGGFSVLLGDVEAKLRLDGLRANELEVSDGKLTGQLAGAIIGPQQKRAALEDWCSQFEVPMGRTIAVGDGANDLEMLRVAGLGVAFDAKPLVRDQAAISMAVRDLNQLSGLLPRLR